MSTIDEIYTSAVYENLKPLRANWHPIIAIELGTVGKLDGEIFKPLGNLKVDYGIDIGQTVSGPTADHLYFTTSGNSTLKFNAGGSGGAQGITAKASLEIEFSSSDAVFFNAAACTYESIVDKLALAKKIMELHNAGDWEADLTIVTDYVKAGSTTIAVSGSASSSIVFSATGDVPNIDLANASIGLTVSSSKNIGYQLVASKDLRPLISLGKVQTSWFFPDKWKTAIAFNPALSAGRDYTQDRIQLDRTADSECFYCGTLY
jgi:hypothetical protein